MGYLTEQLVDRLPRLLSDARSQDHLRIAEAVRSTAFVGVRGEPEVGMTSVVADTLREQRASVVRIDLDGVAGNADLAWLVARGVARLIVPGTHISALALEPSMQPQAARRSLLELQHELGSELARLSVGNAPRPGDEELLAPALDRLANLAVVGDTVVWIDHVEAPRLTPRHPVDVRQFLWDLRARQQRGLLRILVTCREPAVEIAAGRDGAFHGDGVWLTLARPQDGQWQEVADRLWGQDDRPSSRWLDALLDLTRLHPATTLLALGHAYSEAEVPSPEFLVRQLVTGDAGHAARTMQHARTLHRLGGHVLQRIARGERPYAEAGAANSQEINRAVRAIHLAGIITQPKARRWEVTNPLVAAALRGTLRPIAEPDDRLLPPLTEEDLAEPLTG